MPLSIPTAYSEFIEEPHQTSPWIWLWEFYLDVPPAPTPARVVRITPYPEAVEWPPGSGISYKPVAMTQGEIETNSEGSLPSLEVSIDNTTRFLMNELENVDLEGNPAKVTLLNQRTELDPNTFIDWDFVISAASANREAVSIRLELPNLFERESPTDRYNAARCRYKRFGGPECGYVINSAAAFTSCPGRTVDECTARGDDEVARGLPRQHPERFGGFPGIPIQRA